MKYVQGYIYITSLILAVNSNIEFPRNMSEQRFARIMGGYRPKEFIFSPHLISLRYGSDRGVYGSNHVCGGSILNENTVLTAAHCVINLDRRTIRNELKVVVGSTDRLRETGHEQIIKVSKVIPYPVFDAETGYGDVALLHLRERIIEDGVNVKRINLTNEEPTPGQKCIFFGWGTVNFNGPLADELVYMNITLLPLWDCAYFNTMAKGVLCVGEVFGLQKIAGSGDSGGPLICNGKLVGVASYIAAIRTYFASVHYYREWIQANITNQALRNMKQLKILVVSLICISVY